jgi:hypothetical protein
MFSVTPSSPRVIIDRDLATVVSVRKVGRRRATCAVPFTPESGHSWQQADVRFVPQADITYSRPDADRHAFGAARAAVLARTAVSMRSRS